MRINKIQDVCARKVRSAKTQGMEALCVGKFTVDFIKNKNDVFTPGALEEDPHGSDEAGKKLLKERLNTFVKRETSKGALKHDVLNNPKLCNDAIVMCINAYDKRQEDTGEWELVKRIRNYGNGFNADVYKNGDDVAIAYGATDNKMDILTNAQMVYEQVPNQFEDAKELFDEVREENPDSEIILTGTSLGGSLACLIASSDENTLAVTFNAYGVSKIVENHSFLCDNGNSYNYITKGDPISRCCPHIGHVIEKKQSSLISHSISNFFGYFKED